MDCHGVFNENTGIDNPPTGLANRALPSLRSVTGDVPFRLNPEGIVFGAYHFNIGVLILVIHFGIIVLIPVDPSSENNPFYRRVCTHHENRNN